MGIQKSLIYRVVQSYEEGSDAKHKSGTGRPTQKLPPKQAKHLVAESTGRVGVSTRKLASKYGQAERAKVAADHLRRNFFSSSSSTEIVKDDESYFSLILRNSELF